MTVPEFVEALREHLNIVAVGLSASNPHVPGHVFVPAIAAAFGQVLNEVSASPDITTMLQIRKNAVDAFTENLRKYMPAVKNVQIHDKAS